MKRIKIFAFQLARLHTKLGWFRHWHSYISWIFKFISLCIQLSSFLKSWVLAEYFNLSSENMNYRQTSTQKRAKKSTPPLSAKECILAVLHKHGLPYLCLYCRRRKAVRRGNGGGGAASAAARLYTEMHFFSAIIIVITCHSITNTIRPLLPAAFEPAWRPVCLNCLGCLFCLFVRDAFLHTYDLKQAKQIHANDKSATSFLLHSS